MKKIVTILLGLCAFCCTWAQSIESQVTPLPTARPKIMVNLLAELKKRLKISIFLWRKSCASR